ncbi:MAG: 6-carboxytetrahydropterin synthase [Bacteroidales bacterium]|nr:6-carboxytetrahydropterin synthase [Bacteroidales bacterium]MDZ4203330.1 6-carboxytetrahydropterin synthase [Bacteroidales bacterium]
MAVIRITKAFNFEMAHALKDHDGPCRNIHGHTYELFVTIIGEPLHIEGHPSNGMLIDFKELKQIVNGQIIDKYDHAFVVSNDSPFADSKFPGSNKMIIVPFEPTSENLVVSFAENLQSAFPIPVKLHSLRLRETTTSYAEWFALDNP